jgi:cephalosporin hydroxylase
MDFTVPDELTVPATVTGRVNGVEAGRRVYGKPGRTVFAAEVPAAALSKLPAIVEFSVDRSFTDPRTGRPQGLIVVSVALKEFEQLAAQREAEMERSREAYARVIAARNAKMPADKQRELMRLFHDLPMWESMWFHNVRIIKNPLDLWMLQQIAYEVRPDFVVETGTWNGGSALWWTHTLTGMGLDSARVITVDLQDVVSPEARSHRLWRNVEFLRGSSTDRRIMEQITRRTRNARVLVNLDSDHSMAHVLNELRLYAPLVGPGGYIAVEDTHLDGVPTRPEQGPGAMAAVRRFLSEPAGRDFEQDFTREALVMTSYPGGWLRRKR